MFSLRRGYTQYRRYYPTLDVGTVAAHEFRRWVMFVLFFPFAVMAKALQE